VNWLRRLAARFYYKHYGLGEPGEDREVDLSLGHPSAANLLEHIRARRWEDCDSLFLSLPHDERSVLLGFCAQQSLSPELFEEWTSRTKSFVSGLFHGTALTYAAWEVRGSGRGQQVSGKQHDRFAALLEESWDKLLAVHDAAPDDPEPLARLIPVAMGLETGADDVRKLMVRCRETGVGHLGAALSATEALSAKWLGSPEETLEFARAHAESIPHERVVIAAAHTENWLWLAMQDEGDEAQQYFSRDSVQRELRECWACEQDIGRRTDYFRFHALNYYACCLLKMEDEQLCRQALEAMGAGITPKPWIYSTDKVVFVVNTARLHFGLPPT
jgi:hypothetical protein